MEPTALAQPFMLAELLNVTQTVVNDVNPSVLTGKSVDLVVRTVWPNAERKPDERQPSSVHSGLPCHDYAVEGGEIRVIFRDDLWKVMHRRKQGGKPDG